MRAAPPIELRCSELPLALTCPGAVRAAAIPLDVSGGEAELGKAAHEGLAIVAETGRVDWPDVERLAERYGVAEPDVRALLALGLRLWAEVGGLFPNATTEHELAWLDPSGAFRLTGHTDILSRPTERLVRVGDWKTGRKDADHSAQLRGYAFLALVTTGAFGGASRAEAFALWVRDTEYQPYAMAERGAREFREQVLDEVVNWDGRYRVGTHCQWCPRRHDCPAGLAAVRRDVVAVVADDELANRLTGDALAELGPDGVVALLDRADLAGAVAGRVRGAIKGYVMRTGDVTGRGKRLTLQREERRSVGLLEAFPILREHGLDDDDLAEVLEVSLAAAERVVARKAGRGKGAAAVRALDAALEAAGAVTVDITTKLVIRRA
jgi:hypothetical protein